MSPSMDEWGPARFAGWPAGCRTDHLGGVPLRPSAHMPSHGTQMANLDGVPYFQRRIAHPVIAGRHGGRCWASGRGRGRTDGRTNSCVLGYLLLLHSRDNQVTPASCLGAAGRQLYQKPNDVEPSVYLFRARRTPSLYSTSLDPITAPVAHPEQGVASPSSHSLLAPEPCSWSDQPPREPTYMPGPGRPGSGRPPLGPPWPPPSLHPSSHPPLLARAAAGMRTGVSLMHAAPPEVMAAQLGNQESSTLRGI